MVVVKLKGLKYCSNKKWFGETLWLDDKHVTIVISTEKNTNPIEFMLTLLHELLHVWWSIMKFNGIKLKKEHCFIYSVESYIIKYIKNLYEKQNKKSKIV